MDRASERLTKPAAEQAETAADAKIERNELEIAPGKSVTAIDFSGSGAITAIRANVPTRSIAPTRSTRSAN